MPRSRDVSSLVALLVLLCFAGYVSVSSAISILVPRDLPGPTPASLERTSEELQTVQDSDEALFALWDAEDDMHASFLEVVAEEYEQLDLELYLKCADQCNSRASKKCGKCKSGSCKKKCGKRAKNRCGKRCGSPCQKCVCCTPSELAEACGGEESSGESGCSSSGSSGSSSSGEESCEDSCPKPKPNCCDPKSPCCKLADLQRKRNEANPPLSKLTVVPRVDPMETGLDPELLKEMQDAEQKRKQEKESEESSSSFFLEVHAMAADFLHYPACSQVREYKTCEKPRCVQVTQQCKNLIAHETSGGRRLIHPVIVPGSQCHEKLEKNTCCGHQIRQCCVSCRHEHHPGDCDPVVKASRCCSHPLEKCCTGVCPSEQV